MTFFLKNGSQFYPTPEANLDIHKQLPMGTYIVKQNPQTAQLYLDSIENFTSAGKIYGNLEKRADRILNTFRDRSASTGVMLCGEKGSGKTLLARLLSLGAANNGIPTIVINEPWCGEDFNKLIQDITQPAVIVFDEFEKVYDKEKQEEILTLLDGVYQSKKLFIITCNDSDRVDRHMKNRPGRIFYMIEFKGLEETFIREYCEEKLNEQTHIEAICRISNTFQSFNFDILKALVEEMNRYNESPEEALRILNATPFVEDNDEIFSIKLIVNGSAIPESNYHPSTWYTNPLMSRVIEVSHHSLPKTPTKDPYEFALNDNNDNSVEYVFTAGQLTSISNSGNELVFTVADNVQVVFTRTNRAAPNYLKMLGY